MKSSKSVTPSRPRPGGADDALRHCLAEPERIADGEHDIAGAQVVRSAKGHDRRIVEGDPQHREIRVRIRADDLRRRHASVGQLHADLIGALNDMMIGDEVALLIDDHAGAKAAFDALADARQVSAAAADRRPRAARSCRRRAPCKC